MSRDEGPVGGGKRISLWEIDRWLQGELAPEEAEKVARAVAGNAEAVRYVEAARGHRTSTTWASMSARLRPSAPREGASPKGVSFWERLAAMVLRPGPRLAYGLGLIALVSVVAVFRPHETGFRAKGEAGFEARLVVAGADHGAGTEIPALPGDTLLLRYRHAGDRHVAVWYQEDESRPERISRPGEKWPAATAWRQAPATLVLEGEWRRQTIWILTSADPFTPEEAQEALRGRPKKSMDIQTFKVVRGP